MANTLMFEVGIKSAQEQLDKIKQEFTKANGDLSKLLNIKVSIDGVDAVTKALSQIGDTSALRTLRNEIAALNREFSILSKGAGGSGDIAGRGLAADIERTSQSIDRYTSKIKQLTDERSRLIGGTRHSSYQNFTDEILRYEQSLEGARKKLALLNEQKNQSVASEPLKKATHDAQAFETALGRIETAIGGLKSGMSVSLTGDFSKWAQEVQNITTSVRELVEQFKQLQQVQSKGAGAQTTQGGLFDPQKFTTLQDAIDKIISEINRLQQAFTKLGENSSLSNLSTMINGLAVTLSTLSNAIKIQPIDEQVKALLERCEKAEAKLREVGDAAKYLNERAGAKTQQKASSIIGITGTDEEQLNKVSSTAERFMRLLVEIENQMAKIGKIQVLGEQSGFSPTLLKNAQTQLDALKKMVESTFKGTPIAEGIVIPASNSQLAQFIQQFGLLKAQYRDIITEADRFNKATEKGSSQAESRIRKLGMAFNELKNYMKANGGSEEMRKLQAEIQGAIQKMRQLMNAGNFAGAVNVYERMAGSLRQAATATKEYERSVMGAASANSLLTSSEHQLANALRNSSDNMKGQSQVLSDLKMMATQYLGVWGAQGFLRNVIEIGGQLEMQRLSIGAILGDMAKATELFDRIKNLAVKSPFGVVELDQMTKQLSAYGFEYNELFDMTKRLADISAATGTSVDRLALALGHVRSEAALSGYTLRQFSMANIPLAKKLSEELTKVEGKFVSVADVRKRVRTKDIGYEQVLKVLKDLTDEGGMFYNAQEIMSESVKARFKNLKDSMDIMYGEIAESSVGDALKDVASLLTTLTRHWQELGAVLVAGAGYWAINKIAMMAMSKAAVTNNIVTGQFTAKQLEAQAVTGNLTKQQLLRAVASRKMAVADAEAAANVLGLTTAQLQLVRRTGDVSRAMTMATVATSKYSIAQLRFMAMFRSLSLFNLKDLFLGIASGAKAAGVAVLGLVKSFWPMLALSAVAEVFMSMKREAESFADAANYVGQSARNLMKDIDETISSISKAGKPIDADALRESVKTMKEVLEQSEYYTAEQQNQVDNAKTLSEKYDVLLKQLKEMREEAEWQTNNEGLIEKILSNTGKRVSTNVGKRLNRETGQYEAYESQSFGMSFFNDSLQENIDQVNKSNASLQSAINLLSEYQGVMDEAIRKNNSFGLSLEGKSWQEQIRIIAQSGHWEEFVASVDNAGSRFEKTADNVKKASEKVRDDWEEIVNDDVKAIRLTLMEEWGMTEDEITQFAKNNERTMRWLVDSIAKSLSKLGVAEQVIDEFKRKLLELFGVASGGKPNKKEPTAYDLQTGLGKQIMSNVIRHNKNNGQGGNGVLTVKEVNEITGTGEHEKSESEVVKALKERAQKDYQTMKDIGKIYGETSKKYQDAKKKYERSLNIAESNRISTDEILTGKYKDKKDKKTTDEDARVLRERVRILKEAADSYQYWRDKVGESQAEAHMQNEFGQLLSEQKLQLKNADELKAKLQELRAEYSKKPQTKAMVEAIKEIDKELAQLDRKEFERDTEKFLSQTKIQLDSLTRAWDTFNKVREATGNVELAIQLSGVTYNEGNQNLADALKDKIQRDLDKISAGLTIDLNVNLSDEDIQRKVEEAFDSMKPVQGEGESNEAYAKRLAEYQSRIKGIVEEYQKWRDLQRDVEQRDMDTFGKLIGSAVDLQTQVMKINDEYKELIASLDRLRSNGKLSDEQYGRAKGIADANTNMKLVQATAEYQMLMDGVVTMSKKAAQSIKANFTDALRKQLLAGGITAKEYADKIAEINDKMQNLEDAPNYFQSYMKGGLNGIFDTMNRRGQGYVQEGAQMQQNAQSMINESFKGNGNFQNFWKGIKEMNAGKEMAQMGEGMQQMSGQMANTVAIIDMIVHGIDNFVQGMKNTYDEIREMYDALGYDTDSGSWSDANTFLSSFSAASASATKGWDSLKNGDVGGVIEGVVGSWTNWITGFAKGHDAKRDRQIQLAKEQLAVLKNMDARVNTIVDRTLGGGNRAKADEKTIDRFEAELDNWRKANSEANAPHGMTKGAAALTGAGVGASVGAIVGPLGAAVGAVLGGIIGGIFGGKKQDYYSAYTKDTAEAMDTAIKNESAYSAELASLKMQRDEIQRQLENEKDKKNSSSEAIDDFEQKLFEIEDQITHFVEDTSKELWGLDLKGWASQIGDALMTAFENGEDAAKAFDETVKDIMRSVAGNMLKLGIIEPMMEQLRNELFSAERTDSNGNKWKGVYNVTTGRFDEQATLETLGKYFGKGGELEKTAEAGKQFYDWVEKISGIDLSADDSQNATANTIKGKTEQTADLIASYVNATRASTANIENLSAQYFPLFYASITSGNASLANIENHTAAIMRSNDTIAQKITNLDNNINGLKNKTWKVPMA